MISRLHIRSRTRRTLVLVAALSLLAAACGSDSDDAAPETTSAPATEATTTTEATPTSVEPVVTVRDSGMTATVYETSDVTVHALTAPEDVFANSTYVFETENSLVLLDTQFLLPFALDMRAYADALGKPIDRVFITHAHPDHFLGSEAFADLDVYALADVAAEIAEIGDAEVAEKQADFGDSIASSFVSPQAVAPGIIEIDGVEFELVEVLDAEAHTQLVIRIPSAGVMATGDIVYSGVHLIMAGAPDTWTTALNVLKDTSADFPILLPGHGMPTTPAEIDVNIAWLAKASELLAQGVDFAGFKSGLMEAFPDRGMDAAIDFVLPVLFPEEMEAAAAGAVAFGECSELAVGSVVPLAALQAQLPEGVTALSLTAQGTVFDGSDDLGVLIARTLRCDDLTVTSSDGTESSDGQHIAHVGTPIDVSALPATPYSTDGNNGADFNNYVFGYYSDSAAYVAAMDEAGIAGAGMATINMTDAEASECVITRTVSVASDAFGFDASGDIPDAACSDPDTPFVANWWSVGDDGASVLSNQIAMQVAIFIDTAETVVTITPTGALMQAVVGADPIVADAFGVIGLIPASDGPSMTITALS